MRQNKSILTFKMFLKRLLSLFSCMHCTIFTGHSYPYAQPYTTDITDEHTPCSFVSYLDLVGKSLKTVSLSLSWPYKPVCDKKKLPVKCCTPCKNLKNKSMSIISQ